MKQMFTLTQLAARIEHDARNKADYVVGASDLRLGDDAQLILPTLSAPLPVTDLGHRQLSEYVGIPAQYYDRVRASDPMLLAGNVNHWLGQKGGERRMLRTLNGFARSLLSDSYKRIDNDAVANVVLEELSKIPGLRVVSCAVTESRLYIKAVSDALCRMVPGSKRGVGDMVEAGVIIRNSETGQGSVSIEPFAHFLICTNGMVRSDGRLRAAHVGRKIDQSIEGLLSDATRRLEDEVVLRKVRDVIKHAFAEQPFEAFLAKLTDTTKQPIAGDVPAAVEALGPTLGLAQGERSLVLRHLIEGGDLSRYGLANAVTRTAEDLLSYDRATELETLGYKLIELPARDWGAISNAKALPVAA